MSVRIMANVWEHPGINTTQKIVLLALADWANDEGMCWPSIQRIADKCCLTTRAVQKALRAMEEVGLLRHEDGVHKSRTYWITLQVNHVHPRTTFTPPLNDVHPTPEPRSPNTSYIHQETPNHMSETSVSDTGNDTVNVQDVVDVWNDVAAKLGKPKVRDITPERRKIIQIRLQQYSTDDFIKVFQNIQTSPFLRGDTGWYGCGFDWVFKKTNFQKILEGNYNG